MFFKTHRFAAASAALAALLLPTVAWAQSSDTAAAPAPTLDTGNTAFVLICAALVSLMTPGLALFYGGMVRKKNVLGTIMQSFVAMGAITLIWVVAGYSLAFSSGSPFIGGLEWLGLNGVSATEPSPAYATASKIPHQAFMIYQMMFAIITPALISGAFAERMKFSAYLLFISLWSLVVYVPLAHMVWSTDGWLLKMAALDFAGGTVVHISSGVSALVAAIMIGKRAGYMTEEMRPHNLTMTLLGTGLLWFGWYGFNGGSALAADGLATTALVNTHIAAGAALMAWLAIEQVHRGKPTALGAASGAVAGLVGITPAAGFVNITGAIVIGAVTSIVCYLAVMGKSKLGYDDTLDTFGVHGVGGTVGAILTGVFCSKVVNSAGQDGLLSGNPGQVGIQALGVGVTWIYAAAATAILLLIIDKTIGLRVSATDERAGLDLSQHGEEGYAL